MLESVYLQPENQEWFIANGIMVTGDRLTKSYKVTQRLITGEEILETHEWLGKYIPIVPVYGDEANIQGKRYFHGLFRHGMDAARMINYWRTVSTELVALAPKAPFIGPVGSFVSDTKWQSANNAMHQFLEYDPVAGQPGPQRQPFVGVPAGALQEALNANDDLKNILGLHDASLGARSNETSGVAIRARQREGDVSTFNFIDNLGRGIEHLGRIIVDLVPKVYTVPRVIRCVKEDGSTYAVPINQPVMPSQPEQGQQRMPGEPQEAFEPAQAHVDGITKVFDLTAGKYDVTVTAGPSYTTQRQEASESMMRFVQAMPQAGAVTADLIAKAMDWPGADEFAARLKAVMPPPIQNMEQNPQVAMMGQQMQQMDMHAKQAVGQLSGQIQQSQQELQTANQKLSDKTAENQIKAQELALKAQELAVKDKEAETKRLQVVLENQQKEADRQAKQVESANQAIADQIAASPPPIVAPEHSAMLMDTLSGLATAIHGMNRPRKVIRDDGGTLMGIE